MRHDPPHTISQSRPSEGSYARRMDDLPPMDTIAIYCAEARIRAVREKALRKVEAYSQLFVTTLWIHLYEFSFIKVQGVVTNSTAILCSHRIRAL